MALVMRVLLPAILCCQALGLKQIKPKKVRARPKALLTTMVYPDDEIPVDLMIEHHFRMVSGNMSILKGAVIDNRPPWGSQESNQEAMLARYRRSQDTTGVIQVKSVDYSRMSALINRFFSSPDISLRSSKSLKLARDPVSNVSKLDEKGQAARLLGMLHFLELCADADDDVDLCVYMEPTTFVHRSNETGVVEQAMKLFRQNPQAVVLMPPDMCLQTKAAEHGVCKVGNATASINHGFFIVNRDRFEGFAPMPVESVDLGSSFENLLAEGLLKGGVEGPVRQMRCGGAFVIHPFDSSLGKYACPATKQLSLPSHAQLLASRKSTTDAETGHFSSDYARMGGGERATALQQLIQRFEAGKFPEAKYMESLTNKCQNMCPSRERIRDGLAW